MPKICQILPKRTHPNEAIPTWNSYHILWSTLRDYTINQVSAAVLSQIFLRGYKDIYVF